MKHGKGKSSMTKQNISDAITIGAIALVVLALPGIGIYVAVRNYNECRATPHSVLYCLTNNK